MISFVVPAYNEELLLGATLRAINDAAQVVGEPYEIIVADDASSDRTAAVAESNGARVVRVEHRQISATRNSGARAAKGDLFIFVDADTIVNAAVVRAAVQAIRKGAVGGGCAVEFDGQVPVYFRVLLPLMIVGCRLLRMAAGCYLYCTRPAFEATGGFDETRFGGEELVLSRALGQLGRFVILRQTVVTSGRKARTYSVREIVGALGAAAVKRRTSAKERHGLELWYGERRVDPEQGRVAN
jgi:glycosyltransferase involved in cell wall biosynthesis